LTRYIIKIPISSVERINMKFIVALLLSLLSVSFIYSQDAVEIAVIDLTGNDIDVSTVAGLTERLRAELFKTGKYQVIERSRVDVILKEQGFQQSGCTDAQCAVEIGRLVNVSAIVLGSVSKIGNIYTVSIRLVDVSTGKIQQVSTEDCADCEIGEVLTGTIPVVADKIAGISRAIPRRENLPRNESLTIAAPALYGRIFINDPYLNSTLYLNGMPLKNGAPPLDSIAAGSYTIVGKKAGVNDFVKAGNLFAGQIDTVIVAYKNPYSPGIWAWCIAGLGFVAGVSFAPSLIEESGNVFYVAMGISVGTVFTIIAARKTKSNLQWKKANTRNYDEQ